MTIGKAVPAQWAVRVLLGKVGQAIDKATFGTPASHLEGAKLKDRLLEEFDGKCVYCQTVITDNFEAEHLVPSNRFKGGIHSISNLAACCRECNLEKGGMNLDEYLKTSPKLNANEVRARLANRRNKATIVPDSEYLVRVAENLHARVMALVEEAYLETIESLKLPEIENKKTSKVKAAKAEVDYSEVSLKFPLDSLVESQKGDLLGLVVTYSMQGAKGKRTGYVGVKDIASGKTIHRAPSTLKMIRKANSEA